MRKECERRSSSEVGIVDKVNDVGAMAWAVAPKLFYEGWLYLVMSAVNGNERFANSCESILKKHLYRVILNEVWFVHCF